ncbi:SsgA family sporulation/cell division regulator, partial [Kitasatospora sp. NPDC047058]|uniref:SsgA family sporulation/cell division regulator n=1 Tax=Kitasatospora sp. NPDC047058 TaxID=3155620 RepID=UPI00340E22AB
MDTITTRTTMRLITGADTDTSVPVEYRYDSRRPLEVTLVFGGTGAGTSWTIGRELVAEGLTRGAGDGDLRITPAGHGHTFIALSDGDGHVALLAAPTGRLADFLARTERAVPYGSESAHIDWDGCIARLLAEGPGAPGGHRP